MYAGILMTLPHKITAVCVQVQHKRLQQLTCIQMLPVHSDRLDCIQLQAARWGAWEGYRISEYAAVSQTDGSNAGTDPRVQVLPGADMRLSAKHKLVPSVDALPCRRAAG